MKTQNKILLFVATVLTIFISCTKDISVDMPKPIDKLVIEGTIDLDEYPVVFLTKNAAYFDIVDTVVVQNSIIHDAQATVIVSNGYQIDTLTPTIFKRWPYLGYTGTKFKGTINGSYDLKILYDDNEYFATTTIPDSVAIDSVRFDRFQGSDSLGFLTCRWLDPIESGNYYTLLTKIEGKQDWFYRPFFGFHHTDDKMGNGTEMEFNPISRGYERNSYYKDFEDGNLDMFQRVAFKVGDTVSLKLSTIDQNSYNFWNSWYRNSITDGNPFTNPATVQSNIQGDPSNGYWIGYGSSITTVYIVDSTTLEIID
jgi:hypothetical protein